MQMTFGWLVCLAACLQLVAASEEEQATTLPKLTVFTVATQKTDGYLRYGYYPRIGSKCFDLTQVGSASNLASSRIIGRQALIVAIMVLQECINYKKDKKD